MGRRDSKKVDALAEKVRNHGSHYRWLCSRDIPFPVVAFTIFYYRAIFFDEPVPLFLYLRLLKLVDG